MNKTKFEIVSDRRFPHVFRKSKAASWSVAREVLRHYLYDTFSNDDLDF